MSNLSVIVPVYNTDAYLEKCINSILEQTYRALECIVTDDGSVDYSGGIIDQYASNDSRIIAIHQPNKGVSAARNRALDISRGKYIGFVDSDDWINHDMYEKLIYICNEEMCALACCAFNEYNNDYQFIRKTLKDCATFNNTELLLEQFGMPNRLSGSVCNKLFLSEIVSGIYFSEEIKYVEDALFLFLVYEKSCKAYKISDELYNVLIRNDSATHIETVDNFYEALSKGKLMVLNLARLHSIELEKYAIDKYLDDGLRYLPKLVEVGKGNQEHFVLRYLHIKLLMIKVMFRAIYKRMLSFSKTKGYLLEWLKI